MKRPKRKATLLEFQRAFPDEASCARYLFKRRWPEGFICPNCGAERRAAALSSAPGASAALALALSLVSHLLSSIGITASRAPPRPASPPQWGGEGKIGRVLAT